MKYLLSGVAGAVALCAVVALLAATAGGDSDPALDPTPNVSDWTDCIVAGPDGSQDWKEGCYALTPTAADWQECAEFWAQRGVDIGEPPVKGSDGLFHFDGGRIYGCGE